MNRFSPGMSPSHIIQSPKGLKTLEAQLDSVGVVNMDVFVSNNDSGGGGDGELGVVKMICILIYEILKTFKN